MQPQSRATFLAGLSPEVRASIEPALERAPIVYPAPTDHAQWDRIRTDISQRSQVACQQAAADFPADISKLCFASMPALHIAPTDTNDRPPAVFLHGGAYTTFSADTTLYATLPLAWRLARPLIVLDYPLAPEFTFREVVPATAAAIAAALQQYESAPVIGDSAGGGLALAATLNLLRAGNRLPAALVLLSPWADLGNRGDTRMTIQGHDPLLDWESHLVACARAYARGADTDPDASPVFAEFDEGFPATQIFCGTRDILLSDAIRIQQRLRDAGATVDLHLYDGLHHSFPTVTPRSPEAKHAHLAIRQFLQGHCASTPGGCV